MPRLPRDLTCLLLACVWLNLVSGYLQQKGVSGSTRTVYEEACSEMDKINRYIVPATSNARILDRGQTRRHLGAG